MLFCNLFVSSFIYCFETYITSLCTYLVFSYYTT